MIRRLQQGLAAALLGFTTFAYSAVLQGEVVGLADGDTITVLDARHKQHKVRLAGIDAPEKRQPFGSRSTESLSAMSFRRQVMVEWTKTDRYGRIIGKVAIGGVDICLEQVKQGMAWHYKTYEREQRPEDREAYAAAEAQARRNRVGLWRDSSPVPPWDFRKVKGNLR